MNGIVVDASAIVTVILPDEQGPFADVVLSSLATYAITAPPHWPLEIANAVVVAFRRKRLANVDLPKILSRAAAIVSTGAIHAAASTESLIQLAVDTGLTVYDAAYIDLARRLDCALLTNDRAMKDAARMLSVPLIS